MPELEIQPEAAADEIPATRRPRTEWLGFIIVGVVMATVAALTWRKWPDPMIDFGMQLYLPWKLSCGSVLYKDVMYLTGGPVSQYYHALLFKIFGTSLLTLIISNLAITAVLLAIIYRQFLAASDSLTATTICLAIVLLFAFAQYGNVGNFNFITPYCHEVTHGVALSVAAVAMLSSWVQKERVRFALGAGFCSGLVFLTKPEVFTALGIGVVAAFFLFWVTKAKTSCLWQSLAAFLLASFVPLLGFLLYFHKFEGWQQSWRSVVFAWHPLLESSVSNGFYYRWGMGLDTPAYHLGQMFIHFVALALVVAACAVVFRKRSTKDKLWAIVFTTVLLALASRFGWMSVGRSLPLVSLALCVVLGARYRQLALERPVVFPFLWSVFALALLGKLGFFSRIWHYGFALAMPAFAGAIYLLLWVLPFLLEKYGVQRSYFRGAVCSVLMLGIGFLAAQSELMYSFKTVRVGHGADAILALGPKYNPACEAIQASLQWMENNVPAEATLAVLPEGAMINYLSRRTNPTRYFVWNPAELEAFGQSNMVAAFEENSPDYVMIIHRDNSEFGAKLFGQEKAFGLELVRWIERNYEPVYLIGSEPLRGSSFGLKILKKRPPTVSAAPSANLF